MTKEEIWDKRVPGWKMGMTDKGYGNALSAMDEYARQQAIAFIKFCIENHVLQTDDSGAGIMIYGHYAYSTGFEKETEDAYSLFVEQQNKP